MDFVFEIDEGPFLRGMNKIDRAGKATAAALAKAFDNATSALEIKSETLDSVTNLGSKALSAASAVAELYGQAAAVNRELALLSTRTGLGAETLNGLRLAARDAGLELDDIVPEDLAVRIKEAAEGSGEGYEAFQRLGISARDANGNLRDSEEVFQDLLGTLTSMEDRTLAAATADDLFSDAGTRLLTVLDGGTAELERFVAAGNRFGFETGPAATAAAEEWTSATGVLSLALEDALQDLINFGNNTLDVSGWVRDFALGFVYLKELAIGALSSIGGQFSDMWDLMTGQITVMEYQERGLDRLSAVFTDAAREAYAFWQVAPKEAPAADAATRKHIDLVDQAAEREKKAAEAAEDAAERKAAAAERAAERVAKAHAKEAKAALAAAFIQTEAVLGALEVTSEQAMDNLEAMGDRFEAAFAEADEAQQDFKEKFKQWHGMVDNMVKSGMDLIDTLAERRVDAANNAAAEAVATETQLVTDLEGLQAQLAASTDASEQAMLAAQIQYTREKLAMAAEATEVAKEEALKAWKNHKAVQTAAALINVAAAASLAFATIPWPASLIAAAAAAASAGAEVYAIQTAPAPEFPTGAMSPDHVPWDGQFGVQRPEAVVNARGVDNLGADNVNRAIRGERVSGGGDVRIYLNRRELRGVVKGVERSGRTGGKRNGGWR